MSGQVIVTGGGIGGLAAALALGRAGADVRLLEQADAFSEVGAGIQLGPNATRLLHRWGLGPALADVASFPDKLQVRSATTGHTLGELPLTAPGVAMQTRYGAPYATVHRADLHALLLRAVQQQGHTRLHINRPVLAFSQTAEAVTVRTPDYPDIEADALIGADGLWSTVRQQLLADAPPLATGHLAYRALVLQSGLPEALRSKHVTVWLGPLLHIVQYPVRRGEQLNLVVIVHGQLPEGADPWDNSAQASHIAADLDTALAGSCPALTAQIAAVPRWRRWALFDRPPMLGAHQHAAGRVALLGDAAHPMRPYLAQGAGMAIEDAAALGNAWTGVTRAADVPAALQRFAHARWQRNARVQAKAVRNGEIFHATGLTRWGRDAALQLLGRRLLDLPWLYGAG